METESFLESFVPPPFIPLFEQADGSLKTTVDLPYAKNVLATFPALAEEGIAVDAVTEPASAPISILATHAPATAKDAASKSRGAQAPPTNLSPTKTLAATQENKRKAPEDIQSYDAGLQQKRAHFSFSTLGKCQELPVSTPGTNCDGQEVDEGFESQNPGLKIRLVWSAAGAMFVKDKGKAEASPSSNPIVEVPSDDEN